MLNKLRFSSVAVMLIATLLTACVEAVVGGGAMVATATVEERGLTGAAKDLLTRAQPQTEPVINGPDDIVQIYYTSGTTGDPKGVCLTDQNLFYCGVDSALVMDFRADSIWLHSAPMFHLADALALWTVPLLGGSQIVVQFEPHLVLDLIQRERVTITSLPATLISMIANLPDIAKYDLSSLTQIMYGGSPTPLGVLRKAAETFPENLFLHSYGITETTV